MNLIAHLEAEQISALGKDIPDFKAGDTVRVGYKVTEGSRSRVQNYEGVCIARNNGTGIAGSFTVRNIAFHEHRQHYCCPPWTRKARQAVLPP